jgi:hypothetical protein
MFNRYDYYDISCSGKLDNLVQPDCPARSAGGFNDTESVAQQAKTEGWTFPGKRALCPMCSAKVAPVEEKPARAARPPKVAPAAPDHQFPGGQ